MTKKHRYSVDEIEYITNNVPGRTLKELCSMVNAKFNLNITEEMLSNFKSKRGLKSGLVGGQFQKGNIPFNKGKKWSEYMSAEGQRNSSKTTFKKGNIPKNHRPVGSERLTKDGYIEIKVKEPNKWRLKHRLVYEQEHGNIPKGHKVIFADGDRLNLKLDNLVLVSSAEELIMNRRNLFFDNGQLTKTGALISKVIDTTRKREKKIFNKGSDI